LSEASPETVVVARGNDILGDDGVGWAAARALGEMFPRGVEIVLSAEPGLALIDQLEGRRRALIIDALSTGKAPPGTITEIPAESLGEALSPSPHYAGLAEAVAVARRLGIPFPGAIRILAMEAADVITVREGLSPQVEAALPEFVHRAASILEEWGCRSRCTSTR